MRIKPILQHDERDCGAACLAMIASCHGLRVSVSKCAELTKTDRFGTNIFGLISGSEQLGFVSEAFSCSFQELTDALADREIELPIIAHFNDGNGLMHFVVVFKISNDKVLIGDPGIGLVRMRPDEFESLWTGYIAAFRKGDDFQPGSITGASPLTLLKLLKGQTGKLALVLLISFFVAAVGIAGAFIFQYLIDFYTAGDDTSHHVNAIFLSLLMLYLLSIAAGFMRGKIIIKVAQIIDRQLSVSYFNKVMDLPLQSLTVRQTGDYLSRYSDGELIRQVLSAGTVTLAMDTIMAIAGGIILFLQERRLFGIALLMVILYFVVFTLFRKPLSKANLSNMSSDAAVHSFFKESIDGVETIKALNAEGRVKDKAFSKIASYLASFRKLETLTLSQETLSSAIDILGTLVILWPGFSMVFGGTITLGSLITFYALLAYFTEPVKHVMDMQSSFQAAYAAAARLTDILELEAENEILDAGNEDLCGKLLPVPAIDVLDVKDISFRYSNNMLVLKDVSMTVRKGERIGIVGESGSGKTTLAKLLLRFYEPESGEVLVNGINIDRFELHDLRKNIAYVGQKPFLFSDTILNNLTVGNDCDMETVVRACAQSKADHFIEQLPMKYDTVLEENASNLSDGQCQRLALARALINQPQIMVLDEATSNLDTITENAIHDTIFDMDNDMTFIIIAHKLSTIRNCDRIYVMEDGAVAESGSYQQLMERKGLFAKMWNSMQ